MVAGNVKRIRACALCLWENKLLTVRLEDTMRQRSYLFPPGGAIESGESACAAAERETLEETGYRIRAETEGGFAVDYPFVWGATTYDCTTHFFRAQLLDTFPQPVNDAPYHRGVCWLPRAEIRETFAYHPVLCEAIASFLETN